MQLFLQALLPVTGWTCVKLKEDGHEGLNGIETLRGICFLQLQWQHPGECYHGHRESLTHREVTHSSSTRVLNLMIEEESILTRKRQEPREKQTLSQKAGVFTCARPSGPESLFQPTADFFHSLFHLRTELLVPSSGANTPAVPFGSLPVLSPGL